MLVREPDLPKCIFCLLLAKLCQNFVRVCYLIENMFSEFFNFHNSFLIRNRKWVFKMGIERLLLKQFLI